MYSEEWSYSLPCLCTRCCYIGQGRVVITQKCFVNILTRVLRWDRISDNWQYQHRHKYHCVEETGQHCYITQLHVQINQTIMWTQFHVCWENISKKNRAFTLCTLEFQTKGQCVWQCYVFIAIHMPTSTHIKGNEMTTGQCCNDHVTFTDHSRDWNGLKVLNKT